MDILLAIKNIESELDYLFDRGDCEDEIASIENSLVTIKKFYSRVTELIDAMVMNEIKIPEYLLILDEVAERVLK